MWQPRGSPPRSTLLRGIRRNGAGVAGAEERRKKRPREGGGWGWDGKSGGRGWLSPVPSHRWFSTWWNSAAWRLGPSSPRSRARFPKRPSGRSWPRPPNLVGKFRGPVRGPVSFSRSRNTRGSSPRRKRKDGQMGHGPPRTAPWL